MTINRTNFAILLLATLLLSTFGVRADEDRHDRDSREHREHSDHKYRSYDVIGVIQSISLDQIVLDGETFTMSPFAKVHNVDRRTVLITELQVGTVVGIKFERFGHNKKVRHIWIISTGSGGTTTDPGTTDPGTTDPGTTDPGTVIGI